MTNPVRDIDFEQLREASGYNSDSEMASALREMLDPSDFRDDKVPNADSLRSYYSKLKNSGETGWWERHPTATVALAEGLQIDPEDFPFYRARYSEEGRIRFPEFPQLPPLEPTEEEPADTLSFVYQDDEPTGVMFDDEGAIESARTLGANSTWLTIPDGVGKHFVLRVAEQRGIADTFEFETIEQADDVLAEPGPVFLLLNRPSTSVGAFEMASRLAERGDVTVLASFAAPTVKEVEPGQENEGTRLDPGNWRLGRWRRPDNLREIVVEWVEARLRAADKVGLFDGDAALDWLQAHDPTGRLFSTTSDILTICRRAYDGPKKLRDLTTTDFAQTWLKQRAADLRSATDRARLPGDVIALCKEWFRSPELPWETALSRQQWTDLITRVAKVRPSDGAAREELYKQVEDTDDPKVLKQLVRNLKEQDRADARHLVDQLVELGVLEWQTSDRLSAGPTWLIRTVTTDHARDLLENSDVGEWGALARHMDRQRILDMAIEGMDGADRGELFERVATLEAPYTLAGIAAMETVIDYAGSRSAPLSSAASAAASTIIEKIADVWTTNCHRITHCGLPRPLTRYGRWADRASLTKHILGCWAFSLGHPRPDGFSLDGQEWLFPAWTTGRLPDAPREFQFLRHREVEALADSDLMRQSASPQAAVTELMELIREVADQLDGRVDRWPEIFDPIRVLRAPDSVELRAIQRTATATTIQPWLTSELRDMTPDHRSTVSRQVWKAVNEQAHLSVSYVQRVFASLGPLAPPVIHDLGSDQLLEVLLESTSPEDPRGLRRFISTLRHTALKRPDGTDATLNRELLLAVRDWLLNEEVEWLGALADVLIDVLEPTKTVVTAFENTKNTHDMVERAWHIRPDKALAFASAHLELAPEDAKWWFLRAPKDEIPRLFELVKDYREADAPSWAYAWVADRLAHVREAADKMWAWCSTFSGG